MRIPLTHADDIALYLLCQMYDKHVYVQTSHYGWSTLPMKISDALCDILPKCDLELVLLDCWSFGEVVKIRCLTPTVPREQTGVIPRTTEAKSIITGNVPKINRCTVSIVKLSTPSKKRSRTTTVPSMKPKDTGYSMRAQPAPKKVTHCTSGRRRTVVDYSQFQLDDDPTFPAKKRRHVDLKRKNPAVRMAAEIFKTKPLNKPRPIRSTSATSTLVMVSAGKLTNVASTSSSTGTIMVKATKQETEDTLKKPADLGGVPDADTKEDNSKLVPLVPDVSHALTAPNAPSAQA